MALGLAITNRMARAWPGGPTVSELHEYASILGLVFAAVHALSLLGDRYIGYSMGQILVPFSNTAYRPLWVGLGQIAFYLMIPVTFTFYVRRWIGGRAWRVIHYLSFGLFALALAHGVLSGSDSGAAWAQWAYVASGLSLGGLTAYRIVVIRRPTRRAAA
jgi:predicted ferric reductase